MEDRHRDVGLFRYALIREPASPGLSKAERGALVRALAEADHTGPDGKVLRVGRSTIDGWIRDWRAGGFEALVPRPRRMEPRTPAQVLELAEALKREVPGRTAAQVRRIMDATGDNQVCSPRTIQRHFARLGLNTRPEAGPPRAWGRFEAAGPNECWTGDALHGPQVGGRKAYLLAFIDDYSRALAGYRWTQAEDTLRLEAALRAGLASRGVPQSILVDRGAAFVNSQFLRACAVLGIRLIHAKPRAPATKGSASYCTSWVGCGTNVRVGRSIAVLVEGILVEQRDGVPVGNPGRGSGMAIDRVWHQLYRRHRRITARAFAAEAHPDA